MSRDRPFEASLPPLVVPGTVLAGKFQIVRKIGRGGMGVVVEAHHMDLDERVALKFLTPKAASEKTQLRRFYREARTAAKIKSPHVTRVFDVGKLETGELYMVMEYLEGIDLSRYLKTRGKLGITEAVDFMLQAMDAVAEAHGNGIVHRDLKPGNLFLADSPDGLPVVKVLDFGIAKQEDEEVSGLTDTQLVFGSIVYMSPEQMKSTRDVDARTDVYALGVTLYELIAGKPPWQGRLVPELLAHKAQGKPIPLRDVMPDAPPELARVLEKSFDRDPSARYDSIATFAAALEPFASEHAKPLLKRICRIKEHTTRTFAKAKILPELKQFAKEIESELDLDGFEDPESDDEKRVSWSDEWSDEDSPATGASVIRPIEMPLPKPSIPVLPALKQSSPGLSAILQQTAPPQSAPVTRPSAALDAAKLAAAKGATPAPPPAATPESRKSIPPERRSIPPERRSVPPESRRVASPEPSRAAPLGTARAATSDPPPSIPAPALAEKPALEKPSQDKARELARSGAPSGRRRATKLQIGAVLALLSIASAGVIAYLILRSGPATNTRDTAPNPTNSAVNAPLPLPGPAPSGAAPTATPTAQPTAAATAIPALTAAPEASAAAGPVLRHPCGPGTKASGECAGGLIAWCDTEERRIACCDEGFIATGVGYECSCPIAGPLLGKAATSGCVVPPNQKPFSPGAIQEAIKNKQPDFQACYGAMAIDPKKPLAHVVLTLELSPEGRVFSVKIQGSTMPDEAADACVLSVAKTLEFPPPPAGPMRFNHQVSVPLKK